MHKEQKSIKKAIKNQINQSLEEEHIEELKNPYTGHDSVTTSKILTFLHIAHGKITSIYLEDNEKRMTKPYIHELPFGVFIKQAEYSVEHADTGGEPFTNE